MSANRELTGFHRPTNKPTSSAMVRNVHGDLEIKVGGEIVVYTPSIIDADHVVTGVDGIPDGSVCTFIGYAKHGTIGTDEESFIIKVYYTIDNVTHLKIADRYCNVLIFDNRLTYTYTY